MTGTGILNANPLARLPKVVNYSRIVTARPSSMVYNYSTMLGWRLLRRWRNLAGSHSNASSKAKRRHAPVVKPQTQIGDLC